MELLAETGMNNKHKYKLYQNSALTNINIYMHYSYRNGS